MMMLFSSALLLSGCQTLRLASPQISRAPEIRCIVVVQTDYMSEEIAKIAVDACKDAIAEKKEPKK